MTLRGYWIRTTNYEFWPFWLFYIPAYFYYVFLAIKSRSILYFTKLNSGMKFGGAILSSKIEILSKLPTSSFHKKYFFYKNHPIFLKRSSNIQTVSMTTILKNKNGLTLNYTDLSENTKQTIQL